MIDRAAVTTEEVAAKQRIIPAGGGDNYDWANDHVYVKAPLEVSDGRVTLVKDTLKPGFLLPAITTQRCSRSSTSSTGW